MFSHRNWLARFQSVVCLGLALATLSGCMSTGLRDERRREGATYLPYAGTGACLKFATAPLWPDVRRDLSDSTTDDLSTRVTNAVVVVPVLMGFFALDLPGTAAIDTVFLPRDIQQALSDKGALKKSEHESAATR